MVENKEERGIKYLLGRINASLSNLEAEVHDIKKEIEDIHKVLSDSSSANN